MIKIDEDNMPDWKKMKKKIKLLKKDPRVIAGKMKGKKIICPPGEIRPMTGKVKEALFNILGDCTGLIMLDLFTGSGNISIEGYSRGLESSDMVEMDRGKKQIIEKNLENSGFKNAKLFIADALLFCKNNKKKYDIIMCDPPFKWPEKQKLIKIISENQLLNKNGTLVIHMPDKEKIDDKIDNLVKYDARKYGLNALYFYTYDNNV